MKMIIAEWYHIPTLVSLVFIASCWPCRSGCRCVRPRRRRWPRPAPTAPPSSPTGSRRWSPHHRRRSAPRSVARWRSPTTTSSGCGRRCPIVDVVGQFVTLRKVGRNWVGLCPFHAEKTPSFNVREETGRYKCFGCDKSGDVFTFVQEHEHVDFVGAVEHLAAKAGMQLTYTSTGQSRERARRKQLVEAMATAVEWYHQRLLEDPAARAARDYLRSRGLSGDVARRFKLGWAPDDWDALSRQSGIAGELLRATGPGLRQPAQPACRTRCGRGCCSRSSPTPARRWPSAAASCPAPTIRRSTRTRRRRRSTPSPRRCTGSTGPRPTSRHRTRSSCARATPTSSASTAPACRGRWRRAARRSPRTTSACSSATPAGSCWPSTPTPPARARPSASTSGSRSTRSRCPWPACPAGRTRATWPSATRTPWPPPSATPTPFLAFRLQRVMDGQPSRTPEDRARLAERAMGVVNEHPDANVRKLYAGQVAAEVGLPVADLVRVAEQRARRPTVAVAPVRRTAVRENAEFVAVALLAQDWESIAGWLVEELFHDEAHRRAFLALAASRRRPDGGHRRRRSRGPGGAGAGRRRRPRGRSRGRGPQPDRRRRAPPAGPARRGTATPSSSATTPRPACSWRNWAHPSRQRRLRSGC